MAAADAAATILIAEDDITQRELYSAILERAGYRVIVAQDGTTTLELVRARRPDVVLVDVSMSETSGWNVVREIGQDYTLGSVRIIVVTGLADTWDRDASIAAGADSHLSTPVSPELLLSEITRVLKR